MKGPCIYACQHPECCAHRAARTQRAHERKRIDGWRGYSAWPFDVALPNRKLDTQDHSAAHEPALMRPR